MGKIKIHELAKKLNKTSKEIINMAEKIGIDIKRNKKNLIVRLLL